MARGGSWGTGAVKGVPQSPVEPAGCPSLRFVKQSDAFIPRCDKGRGTVGEGRLCPAFVGPFLPLLAGNHQGQVWSGQKGHFVSSTHPAAAAASGAKDLGLRKNKGTVSGQAHTMEDGVWVGCPASLRGIIIFKGQAELEEGSFSPEVNGR